MSEKDWRLVGKVLFELYAPEHVMLWARSGLSNNRHGRKTLEALDCTHLKDAVQQWLGHPRL